MTVSYPLATTTWDDREIAAMQDVIRSGNFTMGPRVAEFEHGGLLEFMGSRYAVMSNSGSSANLLMVGSLFFVRTTRCGQVTR